MDRLVAARRLVQLSLGLTVAGVLVLLVDAPFRPRPGLHRSTEVLAALALSVPTWVPAGRVGRDPGAWHRAVDLRPTPRMFRFDPSIDRLLIHPPPVPPVGSTPAEMGQ